MPDSPQIIYGTLFSLLSSFFFFLSIDRKTFSLPSSISVQQETDPQYYQTTP